MDRYQEVDAEIKELASLIPVDVFCTDTQEKYDKMLNIKLTLQKRIKVVQATINCGILICEQHMDLQRKLRKVILAFNKFVDKQVRYENMSDPIAKMAILANQSPSKMYKNSMIEVLIHQPKEQEDK